MQAHFDLTWISQQIVRMVQLSDSMCSKVQARVIQEENEAEANLPAGNCSLSFFLERNYSLS